MRCRCVAIVATASLLLGGGTVDGQEAPIFKATRSWLFYT
jgi:hypothetical protein